jgi:predicted 2-oxoglutarate/Fe(II)-dependent dioxygenase YbiX
MTGRWDLPTLSPGELAPAFSAPTRANPDYAFSTVAGRYVLLAFMPSDPEPLARAIAAFATMRPHVDGLRLAAFLVARAPQDDMADAIPAIRWMFDPTGDVARLYGAESAPTWMLFDPALRLIEHTPIDDPAAMVSRIAGLGTIDDHAGVPLVAPVLTVPRVFEPDLCRRLIACYEAQGGAPSGVMRDVNGRTVGVLDPMKSRADVLIEDPALRAEIRGALGRNLIPMIERALQFRATRLERYLVACYDAATAGRFRPHRDNQTLATAHRRFAVSINLDTDGHEGGDLRFPEFGSRTYRPPTGGAVVFCCSLLHEATVVTAGRRYAFLPFLYDEAGQVIRDRNLQFLDEAPAAS